MTYQEIYRIDSEFTGIVKSLVEDEHDCGTNLIVSSVIRGGNVTAEYCPLCDEDKRIDGVRIQYQDEGEGEGR